MSTKKAKKDPETMVQNIHADAGAKEAIFELTCPIYALSWLKGKLVVAGGSPPGFGQGRPLGFIDIHPDDPRKSRNKYAPTGDENVEAMSRIAPFRSGGFITVCAYGESMCFEMLDPEGMSHRPIARYTHCRDLPEMKQCPERLVALSPSGRIAVVTTDSNALHVVALEDTPAGSREGAQSLFRARPVAVLRGHAKDIRSIDMAPLLPPEGVVIPPTKPTPLLIATVSFDGTLRLWRTADAPLQPSDDWASRIHAVSMPAGIINLTQPPQFPDNGKAHKRFGLCGIRFSSDGRQLHTAMTRAGGPSFLVSYAISWKKETGKGSQYSLNCSTLSSVEIDKADAVTSLEFSPCGRYLVYGNAGGCDVAVATADGDILHRFPGHHIGPLTHTAIRTLPGNRLLIATAGAGDTCLRVNELRMLEGMKAADVLKVAGSLLLTVISVAAALWYSADPKTQECLLSKVYNTGAGSSAQPASLHLLDESKEALNVLKQVLDSRALLFMSFKDPEVLLKLIGAPVAALILTVLACASTFDFMLFAWVSFATGVYTGEGFLRLLPASHTARNHHYLLALMGAMFFFDALFRSPPKDPSLSQGSVVMQKKQGVRLGMNIDSSNVIFVVSKGSVAAQAGARPGMRILSVNSTPVKDGEALNVLGALPEGTFSMETTDSPPERTAPIPLNNAWRVSLLTGLLQHVVLVLLFTIKTKEHAYIYAGHAVFHEIAGAALLLSCCFDALETLLLRVVLGLVWVVVPSGLLTSDIAKEALPWVIPIAAAAHIYLAATHMLPQPSPPTHTASLGLLSSSSCSSSGSLCLHSWSTDHTDLLPPSPSAIVTASSDQKPNAL